MRILVPMFNLLSILSYLFPYDDLRRAYCGFRPQVGCFPSHDPPPVQPGSGAGENAESMHPAAIRPLSRLRNCPLGNWQGDSIPQMEQPVKVLRADCSRSLAAGLPSTEKPEPARAISCRLIPVGFLRTTLTDCYLGPIMLGLVQAYFSLEAASLGIAPACGS